MSTDPVLQFVYVERLNGSEIIVEFSDHTAAIYTPDELAALHPQRERTDEPAGATEAN